MFDLLYFLGVLTAAARFAKIEVQIEGAAGWAQNLPTWRVRNRWLAKVFSGRPLTGYHLWVIAFMVIVAHLPLVFGLPWSWQFELRAVAFVLFFWVTEDFLWFVFNPHYGLRRFRRDQIWWHRHAWLWVAPREYYIALALATVLYLVSRRAPDVVYVAMR